MASKRERAQFERQLKRRIERGLVAWDEKLCCYFDSEDRFRLHPDEQAQLTTWRDTGRITVAGQTVTMHGDDEVEGGVEAHGR